MELENTTIWRGLFYFSLKMQTSGCVLSTGPRVKQRLGLKPHIKGWQVRQYGDTAQTQADGKFIQLYVRIYMQQPPSDPFILSIYHQSSRNAFTHLIILWIFQPLKHSYPAIPLPFCWFLYLPCHLSIHPLFRIHLSDGFIACGWADRSSRRHHPTIHSLSGYLSSI